MLPETTTERDALIPGKRVGFRRRDFVSPHAMTRATHGVPCGGGRGS
jgi:hypothetical protein